MSFNDKETITVERVSKYGVLVNGAWYNLGQKSGLTVDMFKAGESYNVLLFVADSGKKYINQLVGEPNKEVKKEVSKTKKAEVKDEIKTEEPKKEVDWDKKNAQIRAQGTIQAAIQASALSMFATNFDEWWALVEKTAKLELEFIEKNS